MGILDKIDTLKVKNYELARIYYYMGIAYGNQNVNDKSFSYLKKSEEKYVKIDSIPSAMEVKLEIAYALTSENLDYEGTRNYLNEYIQYALGTEDPKLITKGYFKMGNFLMYDKPVESKKYYFKALNQNKITKDERAYSDIIFNLACIYNEKLNLVDSALYYFQKALVIQQKNKETDKICQNYMAQASVYKNKKEYQKAIDFLLEADKLPITTYTQSIKSLIHYNLSSNYYAQGNFEKAYLELSEFQKINDQEYFKEQNKQIAALQAKYRDKEDELKYLNLEVKTKNIKLLIYLFVVLLVIVSLFGYFRISFLSKKKKIAEQEKLIEAQKLTTALKEHELKEIDKLLEGQEKERIKIANDLHDNLGSILATLKLNFQNLKLKAEKSGEEENQLFDKTDALLEEAYQKVRGIAHSKNAGVIANEGLLPAVLNMAQKASIPGKLEVEVVPFGLAERLDNSLEVTIFRMIQEIITNAIKHAAASHITIHLTQHNDSLNLIIEDNGKGFNPKNRDKKAGMGLPNIEAKVEHLGGTFTIDSSEGRGTSILIDIPL